MWFPGTGKRVTLGVEVGSVRIAAPGQDYYRYQEWKLGTFPRGFRLARISGSDFANGFVCTVGSRPPLVFLSFFSLSLSSFFSHYSCLSLSLSSFSTQSPSPNSQHTDATWHRHASLCLYVLRVALYSDSRHSTRGYYIVKPFNYLGKLLPGIFAPACLNECTWLQAGVWV